jgi:hypothetical protein
LPLDHIVIDLDPPIVEKPGQADPVALRVADVLGKHRLRRNPLERIIKQHLELDHQRLALLLPNREPVYGAGAADVRLDPVDPADQRDDLRSDRRAGALVQIDKAPPHMSQAEGELDRAGPSARGFQRLVRAVTVDLQDAGIGIELLGYRAMAAGPGMNIADCRRRRAAPGTVIDAVRPELVDAHFPSPRIEHRHPRLIDMDFRVAMNETELEVVEASKPPCGVLDPADHG